MDAEEPRLVEVSALPLAIETMLGYAGSIGTALWYELGRDCGQVQVEKCLGTIEF
jgi:hypothetical protein